MVLSEATWLDVEELSRDVIVLIPTGSVEQHGPHLPLITDALIVEEISRGVERNLSESVLLCPTIWLGASASHLSFSGTLSASFESYSSTLRATIDSLVGHRFHKFYLLNGHGGNSDPNRIALRQSKDANPNHVYAHSTYFELIEREISNLLRGPSKRMTHGCEAETSLMLHLRPDLVRSGKFRKDGMKAQPEVVGLVSRFEELTEEGAVGYPSYATAATGAALLASAVEAVTVQLRRMTQTLVMVEI